MTLDQKKTQDKNSLQETESMLDRMFEKLNNATNQVQTEAATEPVPESSWDFAQPIPGGESLGWPGNEGVNPVEAALKLQQELESNQGEFNPLAPMSLEHAQLNAEIVEAIILRFLMGRGIATIRTCAEMLKLNYSIVQPIVRNLKDTFLIEFTGTDGTNDYMCRLTDEGKMKAVKHSKVNSYVGPAPVSFSEYIKSIHLQSIENFNPTIEDLQEAFSDINITEQMLLRLGPAVTSAKGLFLFGTPGNGKTSIAERISTAFGKLIWIPHTIQVEGEMIRLFDPSVHEEVPLSLDESANLAGVDRRWVRVKRSTVVVGGELTLDMLDIRESNGVGVSEAPVQMKSNCGVLVIDDFGRQRCSVEELLNRWIIPLEKRYDYLNTVAGYRICVPFDQLVIFSTNLEPSDLVDEAFLRRIPYKIEVESPKEEQYLDIWTHCCEANNIEHDPELFEYLMESCYRNTGREMRMCHPRDLIRQVINYCQFRRVSPKISKENLDIAIANYFAALG